MGYPPPHHPHHHRSHQTHVNRAAINIQCRWPDAIMCGASVARPRRWRRRRRRRWKGRSQGCGVGGRWTGRPRKGEGEGGGGRGERGEERKKEKTKDGRRAPRSNGAKGKEKAVGVNWLSFTSCPAPLLGHLLWRWWSARKSPSLFNLQEVLHRSTFFCFGYARGK